VAEHLVVVVSAPRRCRRIPDGIDKNLVLHRLEQVIGEPGRPPSGQNGVAGR